MEKQDIDKKVGVITMHRVINYGSFLQSYATQCVFEGLGFKCDIIDYLFPNKWHFDNGIKQQSILGKILPDYIYKLGLKAGHRKKIKIENAIKKYLNLSDSYYYPQELFDNPPLYDIYVTGSDQTWNPKHTKGDSIFLLSFAPDKSKKISFSASIAGNNISCEYKDDFIKYLNKYDNIAIRDSNGNAVMNELIGKEAKVTLDPTLMLDRESWSKFATNVTPKFNKNKYIVFYLITHSFDVTPYIYELLKQLQIKTGLNVYSFSDIPESFNINYTKCSEIGVEHFIELFESSSYVVTSSFHGTAFAVNFGIPLYSVIDSLDNSDDRQASLLTKLGINNCLVPLNKKFDEIIPTYNIKEEQDRLNELRHDSLKYLKDSLL